MISRDTSRIIVSRGTRDEDVWRPFEFDYGDDIEAGYAVAVDDAGNTYIGGHERYACDHYWTVWKVDPTGAIDTGWGYGGISNQVSYGGGPTEAVKCVGVQSDGKVVAGASCNHTPAIMQSYP